MQNKSINRFVLGGLGFSSLREMPERLLNGLSINNLKFWYCLGFRASDLGFALGRVLAFRPVGREKLCWSPSVEHSIAKNLTRAHIEFGGVRVKLGQSFISS